MKLENPVLMAQIGAPHGVKGEVRVKPFGYDPLSLDQYGSLYSNDGRKFKIMRMRAAKNVLVVKFKGVNFRDEAQALNGTELYIDRSALTDDMEDDEFYVTDLIGCAALGPDGTELGRVKDVPNFGAGDLIEITVKGSSETLLLEFSKKNVPEIDLDKKTITISLPEEVSERDD